MLKLKFCGGPYVTGSCFLLEVEGKKYLIDCGMFQGKALRRRNAMDFLLILLKLNAFFLRMRT